MEENRRVFLKGAGAALAIAGAVSPAAAQAPSSSKEPHPPIAPGYQCLSLVEAAATEALVEHMWPADALSASGVDLGIAIYIDRQLAGAFGRGDRLYLQGPFRKG